MIVAKGTLDRRTGDLDSDTVLYNTDLPEFIHKSIKSLTNMIRYGNADGEKCGLKMSFEFLPHDVIFGKFCSSFD